MIILACLILTIVLIVTPVLLKMWVDINKAEIRIDRKLKDFERKQNERTDSDVDKPTSQSTE